MNEKWIKLFPKMLNWEWYKDVNTKVLFIHCLLNAQWKDGKFENIVIPRGSFATGRKKLAKELGLSEQEIRTALKHLISTNELTIETNNKFSIISVVNYDLYQQPNQQQCSDRLPRTDDTFNCHLKMNAKEESCIDCMKKNMCPYDVSNVFKLNHPNLTFEDYFKKVVELRKILTTDSDKQNDNLKELEDFNWLEEKNE